MAGGARDLFTGTAWYYARYRPGYPQAFLDHVIARFNLDGTGTLLDVGCGTGQLTLPLAPYVARAVGLDPEPEMLAEAAAQAASAGVRNVSWLQGSSDDLPTLRERLGPVRLVTMGRSFHWMPGDATLRALDTIVAPGGGVVLAGEGTSCWRDTSDWQVAVKQVIQRWLGEQRRAGSGIYAVSEERWEVLLARSSFTQVEVYHFDYQRTLTVDQIVGELYSTSFCSVRVLGDRREPFERDLRRALLDLAPDGVFTEPVWLEAFLVRRPAE